MVKTKKTAEDWTAEEKLSALIITRPIYDDFNNKLKLKEEGYLSQEWIEKDLKRWCQERGISTQNLPAKKLERYCEKHNISSKNFQDKRVMEWCKQHGIPPEDINNQKLIEWCKKNGITPQDLKDWKESDLSETIPWAKNDSLYEEFDGWTLTVEDLSDSHFLNICYLQRKAKLEDPDLFKRVANDIKRIDKTIAQNVNEKVSNSSLQKNNLLKELLFAISMYGIDGEKYYEKFYTHDPDHGKISDLVFGPGFSESLNRIKTFSEKYGGYDAHSLTTLENLDTLIFKINYLLKHKPKLESRKKSGDRLYVKLYPHYYHKSSIEPPCYSSKKNFEEIFSEINPCNKDFNLEQFIFDTIGAIKRYQMDSLVCRSIGKNNERYPLIDMFMEGMNKKIEYDNLKKLLEKGKRLNARNILKYILGCFIGLKLWDMYEELKQNDKKFNKFSKAKTKSAPNLKERARAKFGIWYDKRYTNKHDNPAISEDDLKEYQRQVKQFIKGKK